MEDAIAALKDFVDGKRHDTENIAGIINGALCVPANESASPSGSAVINPLDKTDKLLDDLEQALHSPWTNASQTPKRDGEYIVVTNYGDTFRLRCVMQEWERPSRFNDGEQVEWWIHPPNGESSDGATHQKGTNAK